LAALFDSDRRSLAQDVEIGELLGADSLVWLIVVAMDETNADFAHDDQQDNYRQPNT
jgi:hypothetical protein